MGTIAPGPVQAIVFTLMRALASGASVASVVPSGGLAGRRAAESWSRRSLERWSGDAGRAAAAAGAVVGRLLYGPGCPSLAPVAVRTALFGAGLAGDHVATSCFCELTGLAEVRECRAHGRTSEPGGVGDFAGGHRAAVGKSGQDGGLRGARSGASWSAARAVRGRCRPRSLWLRRSAIRRRLRRGALTRSRGLAACGGGGGCRARAPARRRR